MHTLVRLGLIAALLASGAAYAQFNGCRFGFCGPVTGGAAPTCDPGNATGEMDFSLCSNVAITTVVF